MVPTISRDSISTDSTSQSEEFTSVWDWTAYFVAPPPGGDGFNSILTPVPFYNQAKSSLCYDVIFRWPWVKTQVEHNQWDWNNLFGLKFGAFTDVNKNEVTFAWRYSPNSWQDGLIDISPMVFGNYVRSPSVWDGSDVPICRLERDVPYRFKFWEGSYPNGKLYFEVYDLRTNARIGYRHMSVGIYYSKNGYYTFPRVGGTEGANWTVWIDMKRIF